MSAELPIGKRELEPQSNGTEKHDAFKKVKIDELVKKTNITERDVGITEFLSSDLSGFCGQIKQRYSDFLVNEIDQSDNVVHLTDTGFQMPKKQRDPKPQEAGTPALSKKDEIKISRKSFKLDDVVEKELTELLGESDVLKLVKVYTDLETMETEKSFDDKALRTKLHQLIRKAFDNSLESVTTADNHFKIANNNKRSRVSREVMIEQTKDENGVENWGYGPSKQFIHFTLYKENKETMDAINIMTRFLRVPSKMVKFAGTKDRRAVTCQRLSISKIRLDRLNALNRTLKGFCIGSYVFEDEPLGLGDLNGNEFTIVIRNASTLDSSSSLSEILQKGCESLSNNGFVNYYGMQRFGTFSISTHEVGKILLSGDFKLACQLILSEQENVLPLSIDARRIWAETKNAQEALKKMPRQCVAENAILFFLSKRTKDTSLNDYSESDYYNAIMKIPRNLRTMYVHAYQSFVWNKVVSYRIKTFGLNVIAGDLVIDDAKSQGITANVTGIAGNDEEEEEKEEEEDFEEDVATNKYIRARPVTQSEIDSKQFTIEEIVVPTPGFDVVYPSNEKLKQYYIDVMAEDKMDPFNMVRKVKDFSLAGNYRPIVCKPKDVSYKILSYSGNDETLLNTDLEILNNTIAQKNSQPFEQNKLTRFATPEEGAGDKTAAILCFKLTTSSYATMLLRELMKVETSRRGDMCEVKVL